MNASLIIPPIIRSSFSDLITTFLLLPFWFPSFTAVRSFEVFWAVPSEPCVNRTQEPALEPARFGIRTNAGQKFHGSEVVIFYESQLGLYPYIEWAGGAEFDAEEEGAGSERGAAGDNARGGGGAEYATLVMHNGGIPQNVDMQRHLDKCRADIARAIPDPHFSGPAVIDYERWRAEYSLNWHARRVYQHESTRDAQRRFPGISAKAARAVGEELFNKRKFIVETIRLARRLRPHALWGFYDTPLCNYDAGEGHAGERHCREQFKKHNDKLWWLYGEVSALYSTVYLHAGDRKRRAAGACERHMQARVANAEWVNSLRRRDRPVVLFTKFELDPYAAAERDSFYTQDDLFCTSDFTAQLGADALIIWSTSHRMRERCQRIAEYVEGTLGPTVQGVLDRVDECSRRLCHARGRCVLRDRRRQRVPWRSHEPWPRHKFTCLCRDPDFYGEYCDLALGQ